MKIKLLRYARSVYAYKGSTKRLNLKDISRLIREGNEIEVTHESADYTKETLVLIAFRELLHVNKLPSGRPNLIDALALFFSEDLLYEIIEQGEVLEYINRNNKGRHNGK